MLDPAAPGCDYPCHAGFDAFRRCQGIDARNPEYSRLITQKNYTFDWDNVRRSFIDVYLIRLNEGFHRSFVDRDFVIWLLCFWGRQNFLLFFSTSV